MSRSPVHSHTCFLRSSKHAKHFSRLRLTTTIQRRRIVPKRPLHLASQLHVIILSTCQLLCSFQTPQDSTSTYGKFPNLHIINPQHLLLLADTEFQIRDEVQEEEDEAGPAEAVDEHGAGVGELVAELDVVVVQPAAGDRGVAV